MAIYSGVYFKEIEVEEGNVYNIFVNDASIFKRINYLFFLEPTGFEVAAGDIFIRIEDGWVNILTGSVVYDTISPVSAYDVVLSMPDYTEIITDEAYEEILI